MNWLHYLIEANLYLAAFYLLYKLLLQNSTFYNSNRYFLVLSIAVAFTTPLIQLGFLKPQILLSAEVIPYEIPLEKIEFEAVTTAPTLSFQDYIFYGYLILALLLGIKFGIAISKIIRIYVSSKKISFDGYTLVEVATEHTAFSFFNILFIHPNMAKNNAVLRHEIIHIQQKHSWDIILLEFLKICCWFNPVVYLIKKDLTLLHEYIADERTTSKTISKHEYAMFLIENSMASYSPSLVNQFFNQSILKSRINMLNKERTANWARLKYLLAVPLGVGLLCVSTLSFSKSYGYEVFPAKPQNAKEETPNQEKKKYYPKYKHDKNGNYISLEERLIVINGNIVKDKNKYYGTAEADKIVYLSSAEAIKKYGADKGKNGAVELYGEKVVHTFPPPVVKKDNVPPPPPPIEAPPTVRKNNIKFPPPAIKSDKKTQTISLQVMPTQEIEVIAVPIQKDVVVQGYEVSGQNQPTQKVAGVKIEDKPTASIEVVATGRKAAQKSNREKLKKEIEVVQLDLIKSAKSQEIEIVPTQKLKGVKIEEKTSADKEVVVKGYKSSEKNAPTKKVQGLKIVPKNTNDKTGAVKKVQTYQKENSEVATAKSAFEKTNTVFNKAWTLYKPKIDENKADRC